MYMSRREHRLASKRFEISRVASFNLYNAAIDRAVRIIGNWAVEELDRILSLRSSLFPWGTIRHSSFSFPVYPS